MFQKHSLAHPQRHNRKAHNASPGVCSLVVSLRKHPRAFGHSSILFSHEFAACQRILCLGR